MSANRSVLKPLKFPFLGKPDELEQARHELIILTSAMWVDELPHDLPVLGHLEGSTVVAFGDEGIAVWKPLIRPACT